MKNYGVSFFTLYNESRHYALVVFCYLLSNSYRIFKVFIYTKRFWLWPQKTLLIINNIIQICQPVQTIFSLNIRSVHVFIVFNCWIFRHVFIFCHYIYLTKDLMLCSSRFLFWNNFFKTCLAILNLNSRDVNLKTRKRK